MEPLTRSEEDLGSEGLLAHAVQRLERAVALLEASAGAQPPESARRTDDRAEALVIELDAARHRQREVEVAAAGASEALGRAMVEVRRTLDEDAVGQGVLDFAPQGLEPQAASPEEEDAGAAASPSQ